MNSSCVNKIFSLISSRTEEEGGIICISNEWKALRPVKLDNIASDKQIEFRFDEMAALSAANGQKIAFFWHTHPRPEDALEFSEMDKRFSKAWATPIVVLNKETRTCIIHFPDTFKTPDLFEREFILGYTDCFMFTKDYMKANFNIEMRYVANFEARGWGTAIDHFASLNDSEEVDFDLRRPGDIFVFMARGHLHMGVVAENDSIAHHKAGLKPVVEPVSSCELFSNPFKLFRRKATI